MSKAKRTWPASCVWPEPLWNGEGDYWDWDLAEGMDLDDEAKYLFDVKYYMDQMVEEGRLNEDYSLNEDFDYGDLGESADDDADPYALPDDAPMLASDYWDQGFDFEGWQYALSEHINELKIDTVTIESDPVVFIREIMGYSFINENLLRQAFTRRAFATEVGLLGTSEELEFYGDTVLNTVVTQEIYKKFSEPELYTVESPFYSFLDEGKLSRIRSQFICKDYLAERAKKLELDKYILYGSGEEPSDSACEDMMEALIGAVAVETRWDWGILEDVVDRLLSLQLDDRNLDDLLRKSFYEQLNTWHQKHFGYMPDYQIDGETRIRDRGFYYCILRYSVPENDKDIRTSQMIITEGVTTRSEARERAAELAVRFIRLNGLWMRLQDAGIKPDLENSINQLQELYQKKYVGEPKYTFDQSFTKEWACTCTCDNFEGYGTGAGKVIAKKKASFMVLVRLMQSAGLATKDMEKTMWKTMEQGL